MNKRRMLLTMYLVAIAVALGGYSVLRFLDLRFYGDAPTLVLAICQYPKIKGVLGVHFSYALLIFRPLCWILPCWALVAILAFLQGVGLAVAAYVIFKVGEELNKSWKVGLLASLAFVLHPGMHGIVTFDIHPEAYALPFVALGTYYLVIRDDPLKGYLSFIVSLMFKETAAFPFAGAMLWRLVNKKVRRVEIPLYLLAFVLVPIAITVAYSLGVHFLIDRYMLFFKKPTARFNFIKEQFLVVTLLSVFPGLLPSRNALLWLPDFLNFFFTTSWYHFKFWYGFQYPVFFIFELFMAGLLNLRKFKKATLIWGAELAAVLALAAVADPLAYYAMLYTYFLYYTNLPSSWPLYPWMSLTTYRPIAINYLGCFKAAIKLYDVASKLLKPGEHVAVNDPLMAIFSCKYKPSHTGSAALPGWSQTLLKPPRRLLTFLATWLRTRVLVDLYGCVRMIDLPKYIWKYTSVKAIMVKDAGFVYVQNVTLLSEIARMVKYKYKWSPNGTIILAKGKAGGTVIKDPKLMALMKEVSKAYGLKASNGAWVPALYVNSYKYHITRPTWLRGKIYVDVNGTYKFYGAPTILKVIIDGKVLKPTNKVIVMQDFVHARYLGSVRLTEGWHEIAVKVNPGWLQLYWKTPYSCAPYPPGAARFRPR